MFFLFFPTSGRRPETYAVAGQRDRNSNQFPLQIQTWGSKRINSVIISATMVSWATKCLQSTSYSEGINDGSQLLFWPCPDLITAPGGFTGELLHRDRINERLQTELGPFFELIW